MRGQVKKSGYKLDLANKFGIFASSLLVTSAAVWLYSPVIGSHADGSITTEVKASIEPVASITLDTNNLTFNVVPTSAGAFSSQSITATVTTNSTGGYELYFSSVDDGTAMTHSSDSVTATVSSNFEGTVTSSTMSANTWGYSLDDVNFFKIPTLTNSTKIKDIDHFPEASEKSTPVYIGTKISSSLPSGSYSKDVVFTVVAHETPKPLQTYVMQDFNCNAIPAGEKFNLRDSRDGNVYTGAKFADGRCWMTENIRIDNYTLTSSDSNTVTDYTIPAAVSSFYEDYNNPRVRTYNSEIYYNYAAVSAGLITDAQNNNFPAAVTSVCPKGWKLPSSNEWKALFDAESDITKFSSTGNESWWTGSFWSSATGLRGNAYVYNGRAYLSSSGRGSTLRARCVANRTMQSFDIDDVPTDEGAANSSYNVVTYSTFTVLRDERDNNDYIIYRNTAHSKAIMMGSLRIVNKEITSADSNLPEGTSFIIPASNLSAFTSTYGTKAAYIDGMYGAYYNFYTATAGWGTEDKSTQNDKSPMDICPKGWMLPDDVNQVYDIYNGPLQSGYKNVFTFSGRIYSGAIGSQGTNGIHWTSIIRSNSDAYYVYLNSTSVNSSSTNKANGAMVQCVLKTS